MTEALLQIHRRIDDFIARFYKRKAMEGLVLSVISALAGFLIMGVIEYLTWSSSSVRFWLWISYLLVVLGIFAWRVVLPFMQSMGWVKRMDRRSAAMLLTAELPEMRDQLINVLDLGNVQGGELLIAAIEQKSEKLATLSFVKAVRKEQLMRFLKINAAVIAVWALLLLFDFGQALLQSGTRVVNYNTYYEKPAPFTWIWDNHDESVKHNEGVELIFSTEGESQPENGSIIVNGQQYPLQRKGKSFSFDMPRVKDKIQFRVIGSGVESKTFTLTPLYYPGITGFSVTVTPPSYTGLDSENHRSGNITVPAGSDVSWVLETKHTEQVIMQRNSNEDTLLTTGNNHQFQAQITEAGDYSFLLVNPKQNLTVEQPYAIQIIADRAPSLDIDWLNSEDAPDFASAYGSAADDYGIHQIRMEYNNGDGYKTLESIPGNNQRSTSIRMSVDLKDDRFPEGQDVSFRIAVTDNNASGKKTSYSEPFTLRKASKREREEKRKAAISKSNNAVQQFSEERRKQREESQQLMDKRKSGDPMQFRDEEQLRDLMREQQKSLEETIDALEELQKELENSDDPNDREMAERVEEQKNELEKLRDEIKDLLDKNKPEELLKKAEEIQDKMDERQRELKTEQMQMERMQKMRDMLERIDEMRQMAEDMESIGDDEESIEEMEDRLEKWEQDTEKSLENFPEMEDILNDKNIDDLKEDIKNELEKSKSESDQKQKEQSKSKAQKKMEQMQQKMMDAFMETQQADAEENMEDLRQLLKNLLILSFEQEGVSVDAVGTQAKASLLSDVVRRQQKMELASNHVLDSLYALAERVPEINSKIRNEARAMVDRMNQGKSELKNDKLRAFGGHMQGAMEHSNELALLLDAILQQMMEDMSSSMPGEQNCQKPGEGQPDISDLLDEQKGMGQEMGQDEEGSQDGDEGEDGKDQNQGQSGESDGESDDGEQAEAARRLQMMMRQEQIRRNLSELMEEKGMGDQGKELEELMEEQERDIILGKSKDELLMRQKEIEIRLLELEKAMREQEEDEQRQAETADEVPMPQNPHEEYLRQKLEEIERIQRSPFRFTPYYEERRRRLVQ